MWQQYVFIVVRKLVIILANFIPVKNLEVF